MNNKISTFGLLLVTLLAPCFSQMAAGEIMLGFSIDEGSTFSNSFQITTGESLTVGLYLTESSPDSVLSTDGLFGFGVVVSTNETSLGVISGASINPIFDTASFDEFSDSAIDWSAAAFASIPVASEINLGTFQFDSSRDGTTVFTVGDRQPGVGSVVTDWLSGAGVELDQVIFGSGATDRFQLTLNSVSAVPEPNSLVMFGLVALVSGVRRHRK